MEVIKETRKSGLQAVYDEDKIKKEYDHYILENDHPCIMAKTVFSMDEVELKVYEDIGTIKTARKILKDIKSYLSEYDFESNDFKTLMVAFPDSPKYSEIAFEKLLWKQLEAIHQVDDVAWDEAVSKDPSDQNFSFSIAGKAFYIVGLHPGSSRIARRSPYATITFNLHWQFEKLREMGSYEKVRDKIRERDRELQGEMNPMLEDFGSSSEAKQYSGRAVDEEWKCPFHHKS